MKNVSNFAKLLNKIMLEEKKPISVIEIDRANRLYKIWFNECYWVPITDLEIISYGEN